MRPHLNFKTKVVIWVGLLTLTSAGVMSLVSWFTSTTILADEITNRLLTVADIRQSQLSQYIDNVYDIMRTISSRYLIQYYMVQAQLGNLTQTEKDQGCKDLILALQVNRNILMLEIMEKNGTLFQVAKDGLDMNILSNITGDMESMESIPSVHLPDGTMYIGFEIQVINNSNLSETLGDMRILWDNRDLVEIISDNTGLDDSGSMQLVYRNVTNSSLRPVLESKQMNSFYDFGDCSKQSRVAKEIYFGGAQYLCTMLEVEQNPNWFLFAMVLLSEANKPVQRLKLLLIIGISGNMIFAVAISLLFAHFTVKPIRDLRAATIQFTKGNFTVRAPHHKTIFKDELSELKDAFNDMASQLNMLYADLERKVLERTNDLNSAKLEAEKANKTKSEFLGTISHELRTPLNGITGLSELLDDTNLDVHQKDMVTSIRECGEGLLRIVNDLLDFSKIESGRFSLRIGPLHLDHCIRSSMHPIRYEAKKKNILLEYIAGNDVPERILSDETRLRQIIIILLGNAVKFTNRGFVKILTHMVNGMLEIEVVDSGIGIHEDCTSKIFDSFSQVDSGSNRMYGGSGLGLSIAKLLVEIMGGKISVKSKVGAGSTFTIQLPVVVEDDNTKTDVSEMLNVETSQHYPLYILMAEDNIINVKVVKSMLHKLGYDDVDVAYNGQEAISAIRKKNNELLNDAGRPYDLIFMDIQMPIMSGVDATQNIRSDRVIKQPIILALTANTLASDREMCISVGMDDFLSKPIDLNTLSKVLQQYGKIVCEQRAPLKTN